MSTSAITDLGHGVGAQDANERPGEPVAATGRAAKPTATPRTRTKKPRPTFDDGTLTRVFKFPSKVYPRSSYYVTSTEIIIRIRKARKRWKLVVPKKRVVSYRTNRWFAKPRWVEIELTFTQAMRLGLVPPRSQAESDPASPAELVPAVPALDAEEGFSAMEETAAESEAETSSDAELDKDPGADEAAEPDTLDRMEASEDSVLERAAGSVAEHDAANERTDVELVADPAPISAATRESALVSARDDIEPSEPSPEAHADHQAAARYEILAFGAGGSSRWIEEAARSANKDSILMASGRQALSNSDVSTLPIDTYALETSTAGDPRCEAITTMAAIDDPASETTTRSRRGVPSGMLALVCFLSAGVIVGSLLLREVDRPLQLATGCDLKQPSPACSTMIVTGSLPQKSDEQDLVVVPAVSTAPPIWAPEQVAANARPPAIPDAPVTTGLSSIERLPPPPENGASSSISPPTSPPEQESVAGPARPATAASTAPPALRLPVAEPCRELGDVARAVDIRFEYASASLDDSGAARLVMFAQRLKACPTARVIIEGHTDSDGDLDRNQALSVRRAQVVQESLVASGVRPEQLSVVGYGPFRPYVPNVSPENKRSNRRAALVIDFSG